MPDHPAAHLFALVAGVIPGGILFWALGVTSWISWIALVVTCLMFVPGVGIFVLGRYRKSSAGARAALLFGVPGAMALALTGILAWLGGTGPEEHGLHWGWLFLFPPGGMWIGMAGIFAGAAYGNE